MLVGVAVLEEAQAGEGVRYLMGSEPKAGEDRRTTSFGEIEFLRSPGRNAGYFRLLAGTNRPVLLQRA